MMTAMLTAKNIVAGEKLFNVWDVNQDAEYHESGSAGQEEAIEKGASGVRMVPSRIVEEEPVKARAAAGGGR